MASGNQDADHKLKKRRELHQKRKSWLSLMFYQYAIQINNCLENWHRGPVWYKSEAIRINELALKLAKEYKELDDIGGKHMIMRAEDMQYLLKHYKKLEDFDKTMKLYLHVGRLASTKDAKEEE